MGSQAIARQCLVKMELVDFLKSNVDVFAWRVYELILSLFVIN